MSELIDRLKEFVKYCERLSGDEKGEAQVFCDRLFQAFGHEGYKEAGATLESRIHRVKGIWFADLLWEGRVLIEMKRRGENLRAHYQQAFEYWIRAVPHRPRYVVLCNFDEFWVYDFDKQIDEPVDVVALEDLPRRYLALNFLLPDSPEPVFGNDREAVTREAADSVARVFKSMIERGEDRARAQRFILQTVVAMFSEDIDLLPRGMISQLLDDCLNKGASTYDLLGGLFRQMNDPRPATAGRFKDVPYFNGGLFALIDPIDLGRTEAIVLASAANKNWSKVNPAVFGTLFQSSMDKEERHALGAHFTSEADILRIVNPTIVRPWRERIEATSGMTELLKLRQELHEFSVLDPACGSGNFLYVAYREIVRLEILLLEKIAREFSAKEFAKRVKGIWLVHPSHFFGIEKDGFGIELAKVTLMLAKKLGLDEMTDALGRDQINLPLDEDALPLDNLDRNFICGDALLVTWPQTDAIIGNPPYQSKNKMQAEYGRAYLNTIRAKYPDIPGRADYCVYWFRRVHDELKPGHHAGLVGTNTIRQNYSRQGGLDYIVGHGGTITEAVSTQVWSGDAVVHVSLVNWVKGESPGRKRLFRQVGDRRDAPWEAKELDTISSSLSFDLDVTDVEVLSVNAKQGGCFQGQTHGHEGFLLTPDEATVEVQRDSKAREVLFPFLTADNLLGDAPEKVRYVIDFGDRTMPESRRYARLFNRVERLVLPTRKQNAADEAARSSEARVADSNARTNRHHHGALQRWWQLFWCRREMIQTIRRLPRYIVCGRVTKRPIFDFIDSSINPNDALMVFPYADDYSFGILQSSFHWVWFINRCSTLKGDPRYTSNTVFDTFPWPQGPSVQAVIKVAAMAVALRNTRRFLRKRSGQTLRELYRELEIPGDHPLKDAHAALDAAVRAAYGFTPKADPLASLLDMNVRLARAAQGGQEIAGPGLPLLRQPERFVSTDKYSVPPLKD